MSRNRFVFNPACACPWCRAHPDDPPSAKHFRAVRARTGRGEDFDNYGSPHMPPSRSPWSTIEAGL